MNDKLDKKLAILINRFMHNIIVLDRQEKMCQGVTLSQHYVIDTLHRKQTLTMNELSKELRLAVSTLTRLIDVLVRDGIVTRSHSAQDRRKVCIELTPNGQKLAEQLKECAGRFWGTILESIPDEKKHEIAGNMKILLTALEQAGTPSCSETE